MLAGHFGLAAAVKSREPQVPLWALMLSTQLLDVVFLVLYAFGIENIGPAPGLTANYGNYLGNIDYSHSLGGALIISVVAFILTAIFWGRRSGLITGAVVFSHWILDLIVHRPDLAILPGNAGNLPRIGLGLWNIPWLSFLVEMAIILVGAYLYYHASGRQAVRVERQQVKEGGAPSGYRQQALLSSVVMLVLLMGTLIADALIPG